MLLTLAETHCETLILDEPVPVSVDLALSQAVLDHQTTWAESIFKTLVDNFPSLWKLLVEQLSDNPWLRQAHENRQTVQFSAIVIENQEIHQLNRDFRQKDSATDVLTFSLLEDVSEIAAELVVPELNLGEVYLSLTWAMDHVCKEKPKIQENGLNFSHELTLYIMERFVHGCLHLLGVHHDTIPDYNKVVAIQKAVIHALIK
jgi:probable rRNA maturation factor